MSVESSFVPLSKAAEILGISPSTIYRYEKMGLITSYLTEGGHRRFSMNELSYFLERMRNGDFPRLAPNDKGRGQVGER